MRVKKTAAILIIFLLGISSITLGAFLDPGWGARPVGMGGAFTAASSGAEGMMWNPAGPVRDSQIQASFMYAQPYMGLDMLSGKDTATLGMNAGFVVYPLSWGTIGLGMTNIGVSDTYSESVYILHYSVQGSKISALAKSMKKESSFGGFDFGGRKRSLNEVKPVTFWGINIFHTNILLTGILRTTRFSVREIQRALSALTWEWCCFTKSYPPGWL